MSNETRRLRKYLLLFFIDNKEIKELNSLLKKLTFRLFLNLTFGH